MTPTDNKPESMVAQVELAIERCRDSGAPLRETARAAIEAMREPTEAMLDDVCLLRDTWDSKSVTEQWKYLIDEALK